MIYKDFKENILIALREKAFNMIEEKKQEVAGEIFNNESTEIDEALHPDSGEWHVMHKGNIVSTHKGYAGANAKMKKLNLSGNGGYIAVSKATHDARIASNARIAAMSNKNEEFEISEATRSPKEIEMIANSLSDKEWLVLGMILGFKPGSRRSELERISTSVNYDETLKSLEKKMALGKGGVKQSYTADVWKQKMGKQLPSQTHQWTYKLKTEEVDTGQYAAGSGNKSNDKRKFHVKDKAGKVISTHTSHSDAIRAALKNDDYSINRSK